MKRLLVGAVVFASLSAFAQVEQKAAKKDAPKQMVDFVTPGEIEGGVVGPAGDIVLAPPAHHFDSMVKVRASFQPELHRSVDSL